MAEFRESDTSQNMRESRGSESATIWIEGMRDRMYGMPNRMHGLDVRDIFRIADFG